MMGPSGKWTRLHPLPHMQVRHTSQCVGTGIGGGGSPWSHLDLLRGCGGGTTGSAGGASGTSAGGDGVGAGASGSTAWQVCSRMRWDLLASGCLPIGSLTRLL